MCLEIRKSKEWIACYGHICKRIGTKIAIFMEQLTTMLPSKFQFNWQRGFRGEDKNVTIATNGRRRRTTDQVMTIAHVAFGKVSQKSMSTKISHCSINKTKHNTWNNHLTSISNICNGRSNAIMCGCNKHKTLFSNVSEINKIFIKVRRTILLFIQFETCRND